MASINLRDERGRELIKTLVPKFDVLIENFKPGTMERWGLGYEDLREINSGLIMVRISGFGQTGPYSHKPGYGVVCEAVGGMRHLTGVGQTGERVAVSLTDEIIRTPPGVALPSHSARRAGAMYRRSLYECAFSYGAMFRLTKAGFRSYAPRGAASNSTQRAIRRAAFISPPAIANMAPVGDGDGARDLLDDPRLPDQVSLNENEDEMTKLSVHGRDCIRLKSWNVSSTRRQYRPRASIQWRMCSTIRIMRPGK